ncbi:MAG: hypothetical protein WA324_13230 [Bryobacteraceae bacterium]
MGNELFALAAQANQPMRSYLQGSALHVLAKWEPDRALELLRTAPFGETGVPARAATELDVIRGVAGDRPQEAAQLIDKAQSANGSDDNRKQLNIISAQASVAAAQNQQEQLRLLLQRGFDLAGPLVAEPKAPGALPHIPGLAPMVQLAAFQFGAVRPGGRIKLIDQENPRDE